MISLPNADAARGDGRARRVAMRLPKSCTEGKFTVLGRRAGGRRDEFLYMTRSPLHGSRPSLRTLHVASQRDRRIDPRRSARRGLRAGERRRREHYDRRGERPGSFGERTAGANVRVINAAGDTDRDAETMNRIAGPRTPARRRRVGRRAPCGRRCVRRCTKVCDITPWMPMAARSRRDDRERRHHLCRDSLRREELRRTWSASARCRATVGATLAIALDAARHRCWIALRADDQ